jgi:hypothetical protein
MSKQSWYVGGSVGAACVMAALSACAVDTSPHMSATEASSLASPATSATGVRPVPTIAYNAALDACNSGESRPFDQPPISGTAIPVAGGGTTTFEAEHFNCGGEGQGYHELTAGNASGTYRSTESVDILDMAIGGRTVQFFDTGEWMAYAINVASAGTYDLAINAASNNPTAGQYRIEIDGNDVTGSVTVPITGSWDTYSWVTKPGVSLIAGQHVLTLVSVQQSFRVDQVRVVATTPQPSCNAGSSRPYTGAPINGNPIAVPGTFEAEHFNCGGDGQAYHDLVSGVNTGQTFRADNEVEIIDIVATGGGLAVNHFDTSEWITYTVTVPTLGTYSIGIQASNSPSTAGPGALSIEIDGTPVSGNVSVPQTTGWEDYRWVDKTGVTLGAGIHTLKLVSAQQSFRIDKVHVMAAADCTNPGLTLCVGFEANPDTQFGVPSINQVTSKTLGSTVVWGVQNAGGDNATDTNRISLVSSGREGTSAIKLQTLDNDANVHSSGNLERSEIDIDQPTTGATEGTEQWWAHSVFIPADSVFSSQIDEGSSLLQFHRSGGGQPNFMLSMLNQTGNNPHPIFRAYTAGNGGLDGVGTQYTYRIDGSNSRIGQCVFDNPQRGVWYDFVHRIKWSYNNQGEHEIWMRRAGGPVTKVLRKTGINTLYLNDRAYLKFGPYHDPVTGANTSIIYDRIRRGTSANAVRMQDFIVDPDASVTMCAGTTSP